MTPTIDIDHPLAWEYLNLVIDEFETTAIRSGEREAMLAVANGPLEAVSTLLDANEKQLTAISSARQALVEAEHSTADPITKTQSLSEKLKIDYDQDLLDIGLFQNADGENPFKDYVEDCLGCSLRLRFDWQLKPLALLGPIEDFLASIRQQLDQFQARLDPFSILDDFCFAMNAFKDFCIADLVMVLMSLKMLIKKYMTNLLSIRIDWTVVIAPVLKIILSGITDLLEQIIGVILAPINCALSALRTVRSLFNEIDQLGQLGSALGQNTTSFFEELKSGKFPVDASGNLVVRDVVGIKRDNQKKLAPGETRSTQDSIIRSGRQPLQVAESQYDPNPPDPGYLSVTDQLTTGKGVNDDPNKPKKFLPEISGSASADFSFAVGIQGNLNMRLDEAVRDPLLSKVLNPLDLTIIAVQDAKDWIQELFSNIVNTLGTVDNLVSGSLAVNFENLGIVLLILDIIAFVKLVIKILKSNMGVKDWCQFTEENPEVIEQAMNGIYGNDITARVSNEESPGLTLRKGPDIVGKIKTCSSKRTEADNSVIQQWILDLQAKGAV